MYAAYNPVSWWTFEIIKKNVQRRKGKVATDWLGKPLVVALRVDLDSFHKVCS